jgi:hypothetical protein
MLQSAAIDVNVSLAGIINFVETGSMTESLTKSILVIELNTRFVNRTLLFLWL